MDIHKCMAFCVDRRVGTSFYSSSLYSFYSSRVTLHFVARERARRAAHKSVHLSIRDTYMYDIRSEFPLSLFVGDLIGRF